MKGIETLSDHVRGRESKDPIKFPDMKGIETIKACGIPFEETASH